MGRTARAGAKGRALTFIEDDDRTLLKEVRAGVEAGRQVWGVEGHTGGRAHAAALSAWCLATLLPLSSLVHPLPAGQADQRAGATNTAALSSSPPRQCPPFPSPPPPPPLLQVIRRTGVQVQQRTVQQAATDTWQAKIEKLEPQVCSGRGCWG